MVENMVFFGRYYKVVKSTFCENSFEFGSCIKVTNLTLFLDCFHLIFALKILFIVLVALSTTDQHRQQKRLKNYDDWLIELHHPMLEEQLKQMYHTKQAKLEQKHALSTQELEEEREQRAIEVLRRVDRHTSNTANVLYLCTELGINPKYLS